MPSPRTIIFDLDGTLIHSAPDLHAAANVALAKLDRDQLDLATIISFIGNGVEKLMERCLTATGTCTPADHQTVLSHFMAFYTLNMTRLTQPYPGVVEVLEQLNSEGVNLGVCTNKPMDPAKEIMRDMNMDHLFKSVIGAQDGIAKKPDPALLHQCMSALDTTPGDTLYVGDSSIDYQTAINSGVAFKLYTNGYLNAPLPNLSEQDRFDSWTVPNILNG